MNKLFFQLSFFLIVHTSAIAESYICASELGNLNRAGEVEIINYSRNGNYFYSKSKNGVFKFEIVYESKTDILLMNFLQGETEAGFLMAAISKLNNNYINYYIKSSDIVNREITRPTGGKCLPN